MSKPAARLERVQCSRKIFRMRKRAYKKYYTRYMNENMSRENFGARVEHAAAQRDTVRLLLEGTNNPERRWAELIERLRAELNRL